MATVTYNIGHVSDDDGMVVNVQSARPPFEVGVGIHTDLYKKGAPTKHQFGFASGDDLVFSIAGTDRIRTAIFTNNVGAIIEYAETDFASGTGKILTLLGVTTDVQTFIVFDT